LVIITILGYWQGWAWTELLWRWLELLVIPVALLIGAFLLNRHTREREEQLASQERANDREIAKDRAREEALQRYLGNMKELILDKGLPKSERDAEVRNVARAMTLVVLRSLDSNRKGQVMMFLYEADLIGRAYEGEEKRLIPAIIRMEGANLGEAKLKGAELRGVDLIFTDLRSVDLRCTDFTEALLVNTDLRGADLRGADLGFANLSGTNMRHANLGGANLSDAKGWTNEQLAQVNSLVGATLPDGTVITEEGWEEYK
jgi:Pentapeptide repeats (8 copies)